MTDLFKITAADQSTVVVRANGDKFRVLATAGAGSVYFHVTTKRTLKGAIGAAKRLAK